MGLKLVFCSFYIFVYLHMKIRSNVFFQLYIFVFFVLSNAVPVGPPPGECEMPSQYARTEETQPYHPMPPPPSDDQEKRYLLPIECYSNMPFIKHIFIKFVFNFIILFINIYFKCFLVIYKYMLFFCPLGTQCPWAHHRRRVKCHHSTRAQRKRSPIIRCMRRRRTRMCSQGHLKCYNNNQLNNR